MQMTIKFCSWRKFTAINNYFEITQIYSTCSTWFCGSLAECVTTNRRQKTDDCSKCIQMFWWCWADLVYAVNQSHDEEFAYKGQITAIFWTSTAWDLLEQQKAFCSLCLKLRSYVHWSVWGWMSRAMQQDSLLANCSSGSLFNVALTQWPWRGRAALLMFRTLFHDVCGNYVVAGTASCMCICINPWPVYASAWQLRCFNYIIGLARPRNILMYNVLMTSSWRQCRVCCCGVQYCL